MSEEEEQSIAEALLARVVEFREKSDLFPMAVQDENGEFPADFELQWDVNLVLPFFMACYVDGWKAGKVRIGIELEQMQQFGVREGLRESIKILNDLPEAPTYAEDEVIHRCAMRLMARIKELEAKR